MLIDSLEWLGHSGFRIRTREGVIYIDPYRVKDGPEADLILITHGHYDHFSRQDVERLSHEGTWLIGPPAVAEQQPLKRLRGAISRLLFGHGTECRALPSLTGSQRTLFGCVLTRPLRTGITLHAAECTARRVECAARVTGASSKQVLPGYQPAARVRHMPPVAPFCTMFQVAPGGE